MARKIKTLAALAACIFCAFAAVLPGCALGSAGKREKMDGIPTEGDYLLGFDEGFSRGGSYTLYADLVGGELKKRGVALKDAEDDCRVLYADGRAFFVYTYYVKPNRESLFGEIENYTIKSCGGYVDCADGSAEFIVFDEFTADESYDRSLGRTGFGGGMLFVRRDGSAKCVDSRTLQVSDYDLSAYENSGSFGEGLVYWSDGSALVFDDGCGTAVEPEGYDVAVEYYADGWLLYSAAGSPGGSDRSRRAINIHTLGYAGDDALQSIADAAAADVWEASGTVNGRRLGVTMDDYALTFTDVATGEESVLTGVFMRKNSQAFRTAEDIAGGNLFFNSVFIQDGAVYFSAVYYRLFFVMALDVSWPVCFKWDMSGVPEYIGYLPPVGRLMCAMET